MAGESKATFTGLEEKLAGDKDKVELNKILKELEGYQAQVKKALDAGVPPAEYQKLSKYQAALEQAHYAVGMVWSVSVKL